VRSALSMGVAQVCVPISVIAHQRRCKQPPGFGWMAMLKWVDGDTNYRRGERSTPYLDAVKEHEAQASVCLLLASSFSLEINSREECSLRGLIHRPATTASQT
jgi:hypothetical protein